MNCTIGINIILTIQYEDNSFEEKCYNILTSSSHNKPKVSLLNLGEIITNDNKFLAYIKIPRGYEAHTDLLKGKNKESSYIDLKVDKKPVNITINSMTSFII